MLTPIDGRIGTEQQDALVNSLKSSEGSKSKLSEEEQEKLKKACKDFESLFIGYMYKAMRQSVQKSDLMGENSMGENIFSEMLDDQICKTCADQGGFGLWESLYAQMAREQLASKK